MREKRPKKLLDQMRFFRLLCCRGVMQPLWLSMNKGFVSGQAYFPRSAGINSYSLGVKRQLKSWRFLLYVQMRAVDVQTGWTQWTQQTQWTSFSTRVTKVNLCGLNGHPGRRHHFRKVLWVYCLIIYLLGEFRYLPNCQPKNYGR